MKNILIASALFMVVTASQGGPVVRWGGADIGGTVDYADTNSWWDAFVGPSAILLRLPDGGDSYALIGGYLSESNNMPVVSTNIGSDHPVTIGVGWDNPYGELTIATGGVMTVNANLNVGWGDTVTSTGQVTVAGGQIVVGTLHLGYGGDNRAIVHVTDGWLHAGTINLGEGARVEIGTNGTVFVNGDQTVTDLIGSFYAIDDGCSIQQDYNGTSTTFRSFETLPAVAPGPVWQDPVTAVDAIVAQNYGATLVEKAIDANGDAITFAKVSGPDWLSVHSSGALIGFPTSADLGTNTFTVSARDDSDDLGNPYETTLTIVVTNPNGREISVNFNVIPDYYFDAGYPVGPLGSDSSYWNESGKWGEPLNSGTLASGLVDSSGVATTAGITYSASKVHMEGAQHSMAWRLHLGFLDDGDSGLSITLNDIPYASYTVYGLVGGDPTGTSDPVADHGDDPMTGWAQPMKSRDFQVNGTWVYGGATAGSAADVYTSVHTSAVESGVVWDEIVPGSVTGMYWAVESSGPTLTIQGQPGTSVFERGALAGIIIKEHIAEDPESCELDVGIVGSGTVTPPSGIYGWGTNLTFEATADTGWLFMGWSGYMTGDYTTATTNIFIYYDKSITAIFSDDADADGDGILNTNETALGTNPRDSDSDHDGLNDSEELYTYNTDPLDPDSDNDGLIDGNEVAPVDYCLKFDGDDESALWMTPFATNTFTVECWINVSTPHNIDAESTSGVDGWQQNYLLMPLQGGDTNAGMGISVGSNGISVYEHGDYYLPALLVWEGEVAGWTHIAVVYDNKTPSLYVNGVWVRTGLQSLRSLVFPSGALGGGYFGHMSGMVDEFCIWNYARTESDIFDGMDHLLHGMEEGLVKYYDFNAGIGSVLSDLTGNESLDLINMEESDWVFLRGGTDPLSADSDNDGLSDGEEVNTYNTDPLDPDSDDDGLVDGSEVGPINYCLEFNGVNEVTSRMTSFATNTFTVECWINVSSLHEIDIESTSGVYGFNQNYLLVPKPCGDVNAGMGISVGSNGVSVYEQGSGYFPALLVWEGEVSGWTHIAVVYDDKTPSLYINGVWVRTGLRSPRSLVFSAGWSMGSHGEPFGEISGMVDEFRVWNYARTESDIFDDKDHLLLGIENGLIKYYDFNAGTGSVLSDLTGNESLDLINMEESDWVWLGGGIDPLDADSDDDGLSDGAEINTYCTDPADSDTDDDGLNDGYELSTSIYQVIDGHLTWSAAKADAESKGGHLAVVTSSNEWATIVAQFGSGLSGVWLGGTDENVEGVWEWITGELWSFSSWNIGEPNNVENEDYLQVGDNTGHDWNDAPNDFPKTRGALLEIEKEVTDPLDADSDDDGLSDGEEVNTYGTDPIDSDGDSDGMTDGWEVSNGLDPLVNDAFEDVDSDGLTNLQEFYAGSNPNNTDSDDDGLSDYEEASTGSSEYQIVEGAMTWSEAKADAESRGGHLAVVTSSNEWATISMQFGSSLEWVWLGGTDENAEGVWRWITGEHWVYENWDINEPRGGSYNNYILTTGVSNNKWADHLYNSPYAERYLLEIETLLTDPNNADSDNDGLMDGEEINIYGTSPDNADSDSDGLSDGAEVNTHNTDPLNADSDNDELNDEYEVLLSTYQVVEGCLTWSEAKADAEVRGGHLAVVTSSNEWETIVAQLGFDLLSWVWLGGTDENVEGVWEWVTGEPWSFSPWFESQPDNYNNEDYLHSWYLEIGLGWNDAPHDYPGMRGYLLEKEKDFTDPNNSDSDDDGLSDGAEVNTHGSDPNNSDSDDDGLSDSDEVNIHGTDPSDSDSDDDGLSDSDEVNMHSTNPLNSDSDGDNEPDGIEVLMGFNPINSVSKLDFRGSASGTGFELSFMTTTGRMFYIESRDSLIVGEWVERIGLGGTGAEFVLIDPSITSNRYYRIKVVN